MSGGSGTTRLCRAPGCGKPLPPPPRADNAAERLYCDLTCRGRAYRARNGLVAAKRPKRSLTCPRCQKGFETARPNKVFCSQKCAIAYSNNEARRTPTNPARLAAAVAQADERALRERCPACGAQLGNEGPLLYCRKRCGWDELLTRHERDPRADCDPPDLDGDDEPPPQPTLDELLVDGGTLDELVEASGLPRDEVKRELLALYDRHRAQLVDGRWSRRGGGAA